MFNNSAESRMATRFTGDGSDFDVFPSILVDVSLHSQQHVIQFVRPMDQGFAMIRKGQRYQAPTGQPALDTAEDKSIRKPISQRTRADHDRFVAIDTLQGLQPFCTMKDRGLGMAVNQNSPPLIPDRIDLIDLLSGRMVSRGKRGLFSGE